VGLRSLLNRQTASESLTEPLEQLTELGRADTPGYGTARFAERTTQSDPAPTCDVSLVKRPEPIPEPITQISALGSKKESAAGPSPFTWVSEASREKRASWYGMPERF
jgi:hypothetical protein